MWGPLTSSRQLLLSELLATCALLGACGGGSDPLTTQPAADAATRSPTDSPTETATETPTERASATTTATALSGTDATALATTSAVPSYLSAGTVLPGWSAPRYAPGESIRAHFGLPAQGVTHYTYAFYRNGVPIPGASGTTTRRQQRYDPVAADVGAIISCRVQPANALGEGPAFTLGGVYVG